MTPAIPVTDIARANHGLLDAFAHALGNVMRDGRFFGGSATARFEQAWAEFIGVRHCIGVANGTDALELTLRAMGASGHEVITAANAGAYATIACRLVGAVPVYADAVNDTLTIDVDSALALVSATTRVIVVTHLYGNWAQVEALREGLVQLGRSDILIVEDCAQAHGLIGPDGRRAGSIGDAATFSYYPTKNLGALGDAGAITTDNEALFRELRALHQYGWAERYVSQRPFGRNSRLDELQAAILLVKMPYLDAWNAQRHDIVRHYKDAGLPVTWVTGSGPTVAHLCVAMVEDRDRIRSALRERGVGTDVHYPLLDTQQPSQVGMYSRQGSLHVSERAASRIVSLPCFPGMTLTEVEQVLDSLSATIGS